MTRLFILIQAVFLMSASPLSAFESPFDVSWERDAIMVGSGQDITTDVTIRVPAGHFLYKDKTSLVFTALEGMHVVSVTLPDGVKHIDPITGKSTVIYPAGETVIAVVLHVPAVLPMEERNVAAVLEFQGCEEKLCLRPEERNLEWSFKIVPAGGAIEEKPAALFKKEAFSLAVLLHAKDFRQVLLYGRHVAIVIAFIAGLLTSLTPCVWPLIPVTLLIIGVHKKGNFWGNFGLSSSMVAGIASSYAVVGILATAAGANVGFLFQQKIFLVFVVIFLFAMSASMFGLFSIQLPSRVQNFLAKIGGSGYRGAFLSGISLGFVATPCIGPVLGPMILWVAMQKEYIFGVELLAAYALGVGIFYIIVGTFYGTLAGRVKNVKVGLAVKKILGAVILIPAFYYLNSLVPVNGFFNGKTGWQTDEPAAIIEAAASKKPLMIVFGAKWCPPCQELEHKVLNDPKIEEAIKKLVALHIDATSDSEEIRRVLDKYRVIGWPTILFVSPEGKVYDDLSVVGDVPA
ncbi:MAG: thioredoxin family protein, partial [Deltaproteobacteria bacterium]|nr:thioredoxin family protein [Deltaproteobacteria bacterium]